MKSKPSNIRKKKPSSRKEMRKQQREQKKSGKILHILQLKRAKSGGTAETKDSKSKPDENKLGKLSMSKKSSTDKEKGKRKIENEKLVPPFVSSTADPDIEAEDKEIKRLEKLMGIEKGKDRNKAASKLNKEYELFEGIGGKFGDFLMDLDDLTDMVEGKGGKEKVFAGDNEDSDNYDEEGDLEGSDIDTEDEEDEGGSDDFDMEDEEVDVDDDEHYGQDDDDEGEGVEDDEDEDEDEGGWGSEEDDGGMEYEDDDDDENEVGDDEKDDGSDHDNEGMEERDSDDSGDDDDDDDDDEGNGDDDENTNSEGEDDGEEEDDSLRADHTYHPSTGEDIYGRPLNSADGSAKAGKYVPPARRAQLMTTIDESSESVRMVRKRMNGLFNRLSDQSKDSIAREIKSIFDTNSVSVGNVVLRDCVLASCGNSSQMMTSLIPIYAAVVAALHVAKGVEVGAFMIENLAVSLHKALKEDRESAGKKSSGSHEYITSKLPSNILLLLMYLYNLRVLHHTLIVDIMNLLAFSSTDNNSNTDSSSKKEATSSAMRPVTELEAELLVCLVDHCGVQLRADDPVALKDAITALTKRAAATKGDDSKEGSGSGRVRFMIEALADLKNNKSRRAQSTNAEIVKNLRKWLGSIKGSIGGNRPGSDVCLRVSLTDLLDADKKGRWWKAGARWAGRSADEQKRDDGKKDHDEDDGDDDDMEEEDRERGKKKKTVSSEEQQLLELASKMRFTTSVRKNIFVVMMSSRDVNDAYERLQRLELKGKQDREIMRVITECCAQEKSYNAFYAELACLLCANNRQYKTTLQYTFWDHFKLFVETDVAERRVVNLARFLSHVVVSFHLPLAVLKPIDMSELNSHLVLFLATFFMALFSAKVSDETFQTILDRVATTKDFAIVRDCILLFLQRHLRRIPKGLDAQEIKAMEKRRKLTVKTMEQMAVLDMAAGEAEDRD